MRSLSDRPIEYKLVWDREEYYNLKYRVKDATLWEKLTKWWARWTTLMKYYEPSSYDDFLNFDWLSYDFYIKDNNDGERLIAKLYNECPTFGKFHEVYRRPQHEKEEKYKRRKKEYFDRINQVKSEFK